MYKIYADNTLIYDSTLEDYRIQKGEITLEIGKAGSFVFTMYPDNPFYDSIVKMRTIITVYRDSQIIFRGRALKTEDGFYNSRVVTCEGELNFLLDSIIRPYSFSGSPEDLFKKFINEHNSQVDESKRFIIGSVTIADANNYIARSNSAYEDALSNINNHLIGNTLGGYLFITHDEDGNSIMNYYADFQETSRQVIEFGENLLDYTRITDAEAITTVLIPLGAKLTDDEGNDTEERLTIASVNNGKDYIEDPDAINLYGRIVKICEWDDVTVASNLLTKGREKLTELILQNVTIELNAIDLHLLDKSIESFSYGMYIRVISEPHNLDALMLCSKQTINLLKPDNDSLTLGYNYKTLSESTSTEQRTVEKVVNKASSEISNIYRNLNSKSGLYFTEETFEDGSVIHYIHDKVDRDTSSVIWKMTIDSIAVSTDGGKNYIYGITADGDAIFNIIETRKISTDYIIAGKLIGFTIENSSGTFKVDPDGGITIQGTKGNIDISSTGHIFITDAESGSSSSLGGITIQNGDIKLRLYKDLLSFSDGGSMSCFSYSGSAKNLLLREDHTAQLLGNVFYGTLQEFSDERLKNIESDIGDQFDEFLETSRKCVYTWKDENKDQKKRFGFIAQDLQDIFGDDFNIVSKDSDGYLTVNYVGLIPVLTEILYRTKKRVDELERLLVKKEG